MESSWSLRSNFKSCLLNQTILLFSMYLESKSCQECLWSILLDQMKAKKAPVLLPWPCDILTWCYPPSPPVPHLPLLPMLYWILLMLHKSMLSISLPWLRNVGMITYSFPLEDCFVPCFGEHVVHSVWSRRWLQCDKLPWIHNQQRTNSSSIKTASNKKLTQSQNCLYIVEF